MLRSASYLSIIFFLVYVSAECPNGCSGNGACVARDQCDCYKNFMGNDCSEKICPFGSAHVDTSKGDLNMDGSITTATGVINQMYPTGTYEKYNPNAAADEAHFYMECSNNGICDRNTGLCECFEWYDGSACQRQSCPNNCNSHGTCQTISQFGTKVTTSTLYGQTSTTTLTSTTYSLWDANLIMGCRCDPWYYGKDCSLRHCKVGVDPLYEDRGDAVYETFVIRAIADGTTAGQTAYTTTNMGYFRLRIFDYWGDSYLTRRITIAKDLSLDIASDVQLAIRQIPNGAFSGAICAKAGTSPFIQIANVKGSFFGSVVACTLATTPGMLRTPEIVDYRMYLTSGVDFATSTVEILPTTMKGENIELATTIGTSTASIVGGSSTTTIVLGAADTVLTTRNAISLLKINQQYVLVTAGFSSTSLTMAYAWKYSDISAATYFISTATVYQVLTTEAANAGLVTVTAIAIGSKTWTIATAASTTSITYANFAVGDTVFFENQFFRVLTLGTISSNAGIITVDRSFLGTAATGAAVSSGTGALYKVVIGTGATDTYTYVSECAGKGLCDPGTGLCNCFRGYTNDNCDEQNILSL